MSKHTLLPWLRLGGSPPRFQLPDGTIVVLSVLPQGNANQHDIKLEWAVGDIILRAVNSHAELLEACKELMWHLRENCTWRLERPAADNERGVRAIELAEAAIAKATE